MNISKETIAVLKNFSDINQNILVKLDKLFRLFLL